MAKVVKRTFSLTEEQAKFIDSQVESGKFASGSEVVRDGLRTMQEHNAAFERWMREEVLPTIAEYKKDPGQLIPLKEAFAMLDARMAEREANEAPKRRRRA